MTSEVATTTLTDFLLARIAEDEAEIDEYPFDDEQRAQATRAARECEAKRRIVELHGPHGQSDELPCRELASIAAVYADHPDYREAWRP